jgi:hypothetical protein
MRFRSPPPVPIENSVCINQHACGTLIAELVDALSLSASTSESKDWQSLPRQVVECIQCREFASRKNPILISKSLIREIKEKHHFHSGKQSISATDLLRLSGASLI